MQNTQMGQSSLRKESSSEDTLRQQIQRLTDLRDRFNAIETKVEGTCRRIGVEFTEYTTSTAGQASTPHPDNVIWQLRQLANDMEMMTKHMDECLDRLAETF